MEGRERHRLAEAELCELRRLGLVARVVDLVGDHDDGLAERPQAVRDNLIERGPAGEGVDDEQDDVGAPEGTADLLLDVGLEVVVVDDADAAGVDELEVVLVVLDDHGDAVARDAGSRVDDADPLAGEDVQQRALADVRAANDGDNGQRHSADHTRPRARAETTAAWLRRLGCLAGAAVAPTL